MNNFIETSKERLEKEYEKINNTLMRVYVIPFCDRYRLKFIEGNGAFIFVTENNKTLHIEYKTIKTKTSFWREFYDVYDLIWEVSSLINYRGYDYTPNNN